MPHECRAAKVAQLMGNRAPPKAPQPAAGANILGVFAPSGRWHPPQDPRSIACKQATAQCRRRGGCRHGPVFDSLHASGEPFRDLDRVVGTVFGHVVRGAADEARPRTPLPLGGVEGRSATRRRAVSGVVRSQRRDDIQRARRRCLALFTTTACYAINHRSPLILEIT